ncbi:hypothetical protein DSO57_1014607 [Entomophthora muscae]|uniref:Uncharacterized protein n=1 Tax=Entomophthora muscae TaxID=34485 RepID=A0ACC2UR63_9FUNG|nr:hypothetical protein DSO57_1014607 [Entomophthora muscae]
MLELPCIVLHEVLGCISSSELRQLRGVNREWNCLLVPFAMASMPLEPRGKQESYSILKKYGRHVREVVIGKAAWRHELKDKALYLASLMPNVKAIRTSGDKRLNIDVEGLLQFGLALPKLKHFSAIGLKDEMCALEPLLKKMSSVELEICWKTTEKVAAKLNPNLNALLVQGTYTLNSLSLLLQQMPSLESIQYRPTPSYATGILHRDILNSPLLFSFGTLFHVSFDTCLCSRKQTKKYCKSYSDLFAILKLAFHPHFSTSQLLKSHLPPIHAIDYTAIGDEYKLDSLVLPQLTEAKHITLRWSPEVAEPNLPQATYAATSLTINGRITAKLFPWLDLCFPNLTSLSLVKPVPRDVIPSISHSTLQLITFATPAVQFIDFYESLIASSPQLFCLATNDPLPELELHHPHISFVPHP